MNGVSRFYITTAIDYANGDPHLGHAFEKIGADAIARFHRLRGDDVHFLIGMDEHGQKVAQAAESAGLAPEALADDIAERFQAMWRRLDISHDQFVRTTGAHHKAGVQALIRRIAERNPDDFYQRAYEGWYCVGCESFKPDAEIVDGPLHAAPHARAAVGGGAELVLPAQPLPGLPAHLLLTERPEFLQPESRRNEILGLLDQGLEDISASRSRFSWGVPFPLEDPAGGSRRPPTSGSTRCRTISPPPAIPTLATRHGGRRSCT